MSSPTVVLIAGPTASGKSALALAVAERYRGVVINADSMQVYRDLRVLTARPSEADEARAPHRLFGHVDGADAYSVGRYVSDAAQAVSDATASGRLPIVVGGTGLYFKALIEGLSPVPAISEAVRQHWRDKVQEIGAQAAHALLRGRDREMAERLSPGDAQRITRALEVVEATGRSLAEWQREPRQPSVDISAAVNVVLRPERAFVTRRSDERFVAMINGGAIDEVRALRARGLSDELPIMRALGVACLAGLLSGSLTRDAAIAAGQLETRQYIKRQETWLSRNMKSWNAVIAQDYVEMRREIFSLIDD